MKQPIIKDYSWLDIIEPQALNKSILPWQYIIVISLVLTMFYLFAKRHIILYHINLWRIKRKLHKDNDTRKCAQQLLKLLYLDKTALNKKTPVNILSARNTTVERNFLLDACYAKNRSDIKTMIEFLESLGKGQK